MSNEREVLDPGIVVEVAMLKGLLDRINDLLEPSGWELRRAPSLDSEVSGNNPMFLAVMVPGGPAEAAFLALRDQS